MIEGSKNQEFMLLTEKMRLTSSEDGDDNVCGGRGGGFLSFGGGICRDFINMISVKVHNTE
jgi:hypothetical protein